ncbi:MAG TPA: cupin domain-containing protein [Vicinamibacteria bacterium]|nr:cupin domain-containing protein [Vicinamibacteria bacterium]
MSSSKVNIEEKLASFEDQWVPKIVGELNGQYVKLVKSAGEYVWHHHREEDEMFLVVSGRMQIHLRDGIVDLSPGEFFIVPRGVEHKPVVPEGVASVLLFEPKTTRNTGNVDHEYTIEPERLQKL